MEGSYIGINSGDVEGLTVQPDAKAPSVGVKFDAGKPGFELLPEDALGQINDIFRYGAQKYAPRNWEKGMEWTRLANAMLRHVFAWMRGEEMDAESGKPHLAHAGACVLMLLSHQLRKIGKDDRLV